MEWLFFFWPAVAGFARAAWTVVSERHAEQSVFRKWWKYNPKRLEWFEGKGGNARWNPAWIWTADFWHAMVLLAEYSAWIMAPLWIRFFPLEGWLVLFYPLAVVVEGRCFVLGKHTLFIAREWRYSVGDYRTIWQFIASTIIFWKNWHKETN